jgi:hypothetical protein
VLEELPIELRPVPYRYKNALSWRVASDLCRRDPSLIVTFPEGGSSAFTNSLMIGKGQELSYEMRRLGGGVVSHARGLNMLSWEKAFSFANPRELVKELEKLGGVHVENTPPTAPRALGYRVISAVLDILLMDAREWDWYPRSTGSLERQGEGPAVSITDWQRWTPEDTRWHLRRDETYLAEIDSYGWIRTRRYSGPLLALYDRLDRKLGRVVNEVLGDVLP